MKKAFMILAFSAFGTMASAQTTFLSVPELSQPLIEGRAADIVRKGCPAYKPNLVRALREIRGLERRAMELGFSKAEIQSTINDRASKDQVTAAAQKILRDLGHTGDQASLCAAGDRLVQTSAVARRLIRR